MSRRTTRRTSILGRLGVMLGSALLLYLAVVPGVAIAADPGSSVDDGGGSHSLPPKGGTRGHSTGPTGNFGSTADLEYHNGPVMRDVTNYLIFWNPPGSTFASNYRTIIEQYFTDVGSTPFMEINSQYGDTSGVNVPATNHLWRRVAGHGERVPACRDGRRSGPAGRRPGRDRRRDHGQSDLAGARSFDHVLRLSRPEHHRMQGRQRLLRRPGHDLGERQVLRLSQLLRFRTRSSRRCPTRRPRTCAGAIPLTRTVATWTS